VTVVCSQVCWSAEGMQAITRRSLASAEQAFVGLSLQQPRLRRATNRGDSLDVETMQGEMQMRQAALRALRNDAGPLDLQ
jgi:hypothetical protein